MNFFEFLISNLIVAVIFTTLLIYTSKKQNKKQPSYEICDSCSHLYIKHSRKASSHYRYCCDMRSVGFDYPPEFCKNYDRRNTPEIQE